MKIGDIVVYNGGTGFYYPCDDPSVLKTGMAYEVSFVNESCFHTDVRLKGVKGVFNSVWFEPASARKIFGFNVLKRGYNTFAFVGDKVVDSEGRELGTIENIARFAHNNKLVIDFSQNIVRKAD